MFVESLHFNIPNMNTNFFMGAVLLVPLPILPLKFALLATSAILAREWTQLGQDHALAQLALSQTQAGYTNPMLDHLYNTLIDTLNPLLFLAFCCTSSPPKAWSKIYIATFFYSFLWPKWDWNE